ncbi:MAG TPA: hypothetical protein VJV79_18190, partial [Polyangiaceae bacterium]|nr:hypothetical protein [Polyangiaceae bacterium]
LYTDLYKQAGAALLYRNFLRQVQLSLRSAPLEYKLGTTTSSRTLLHPMDQTLTAARALVEEYATGRAVWFSQEVIDRGTYWFFPVGFVGSSGVIVNKSDLALFPMGSALSLDDCFWGHEHGFSPELVVLRILEVHNRDQTVEFLLPFAGAPKGRNPNPRRVWTRNALTVLPFDCPPQCLWLKIPQFRGLQAEQTFEYQLLAALAV